MFKAFIVKHRLEIIMTAAVVVIAAGIGTAAYVKSASELESELEQTTVAETVTEETTTEKVTEEETTADPREGLVQSLLTGEYVDEETASKRPLAVMINNIVNANPQSGIGSAGVIYEAPVEGGITRLMAIFEDYSSVERIGSVRSCRIYYCYFALEFDAIYAHYGQSKYALSFVQSSSIDNVGSYGTGASAYYRDSSISSPHNVFFDPEDMAETIESLGYDTEYDDDYEGKFVFAEDEDEITLDDGTAANTVYPGYSVNNPYFVYNEETGLYERYQYGSAHVDKTTGEQLTCKNIIIQCVASTYYDDNKSLSLTLTGTGSGYYITGGKAVSVTWKKESETGITRYYDSSGDEITLNIGKTWVLIVQSSQSSSISISE